MESSEGVGAWEGDLSLVLEYLYSLVNFAKLKVSRYVPPSEGAWGGTEVRRGAWEAKRCIEGASH